MFTYITFLFVTCIEAMSLLRERNTFYLLPLLKGHLYSGERNTFSGSRNAALTSIQGTF